jgi:hypothetical protein
MRAGRLGSLLPSPRPSQGEIPPRSPQALGSQNNPAGEGRLSREGKREGRRAELRGAAGASAEQARGEEALWGSGGTHQPLESLFVLILVEPFCPPATPRVGRKLFCGSISQLAGCTIPGGTV